MRDNPPTARDEDGGGVDGDVEVALQRVVLGYRAVAAGWLGLLAVVAWSGGSVSAWVALSTAGLVAVWAAVTVWVGAVRPSRLASPWWLAADVAVAAWALVGPSLIEPEPIAFAGGYPFSAVAIAAWARRWPGALGAAAVLATASVLRPGRMGEGADAFQAATNDFVFFLLAAGVTAWGITVIRRNDEQRRAAQAALADARAEQARAEERAQTAAHLHDSVLQTLALVQRRSEDAAEVRSLARQQERELREWLFTPSRAVPGGSLTEAIEATAGEVERRHGVAMDVVTVGDAPLDDRCGELVAAAREAMVNAAKHAGVSQVSVFAEVGQDSATVFVRDRGAGFEPSAVPSDRRGISESIVARLERCGGEATIRSGGTSGTEVELVLPLRQPDVKR